MIIFLKKVGEGEHWEFRTDIYALLTSRCNPKGPAVRTRKSAEHTERTYLGKAPLVESLYVCVWLTQVPVNLKQHNNRNQLYSNGKSKLKVLVVQPCLTLCDPMDCRPPCSPVHGILQARILEWVAILFPRDLPDPGIELGSPALQADSLLSEPPGKPNRKLKLARKTKQNKTNPVWRMKKCCRLVAAFGNNNGNLCANGYLKVSHQAWGDVGKNTYP